MVRVGVINKNPTFQYIFLTTPYVLLYIFGLNKNISNMEATSSQKQKMDSYNRASW